MEKPQQKLHPPYRIYRSQAGGGKERLILGIRRRDFVSNSPLRRAMETWLRNHDLPFQVWVHSSLFDVDTEGEATIACPNPRFRQGEYVDYTVEAPAATIEAFLTFLEGGVGEGGEG